MFKCIFDQMNIYAKQFCNFVRYTFCRFIHFQHSVICRLVGLDLFGTFMFSQTFYCSCIKFIITSLHLSQNINDVSASLDYLQNGLISQVLRFFTLQTEHLCSQNNDRTLILIYSDIQFSLVLDSLIHFDIYLIKQLIRIYIIV